MEVGNDPAGGFNESERKKCVNKSSDGRYEKLKTETARRPAMLQVGFTD